MADKKTRLRRRIRIPQEGKSLVAKASPGDTRARALKKRTMIKEVEASRGLINLACRKARVSERTHRSWMANDERYAESIQDSITMGKDMVEFRLLQKCDEGDVAALRLFLSARCKERGYGVQRSEQTGVNGGAIQVDSNSPTIEDVMASSTVDQLASMVNNVRRNANRIDSRTGRN